MMRQWNPMRMIVVGVCLAATLAGCAAQTRRKVLAFFFDGSRATPPTRRLRRDLLQEVDELQRALAEVQATVEASRTLSSAAPAPSSEPPRPPIEQAKTWKEAAARLPKDSGGEVDWVQALKSGVVAPRHALDPHAPVQAVFDLDVDVAHAQVKTMRARFSHASHTQWLSCQNCHPAIFPLSRQAPPTVVTMAKIRQGQLCGVCHGSVAFGVKSACARCHAAASNQAAWHPSAPPAVPIERVDSWEQAQRMLPTAADGSPDWTAALVRGVIAPRPGISPQVTEEPVFASDVVRVPAGSPEYAVMFPHTAHTAWLKCESCHPQPFQMKGGATPMSMDQINAGALCGRCHGTVAFSADACTRCHTAMEGGP